MNENKDIKTALPKLRFPEFQDNKGWSETKLCNIAKRITSKNKNSVINRVLTNSAADGIVDQRDYFDKNIANHDNLEGYYIVNEGDYVYNPRISSTAPVGPLSKNKIGQGVISPLYTVFRFRNTSNDFYVQYFKSTNWHKYLNEVSNKGARFDRMSITASAFMDMPIPLLDVTEQQKIAECLSSLDDVISGVSDKIVALKEYKKGLMQQLFPAEGKTIPAYRFPEFQNDGEWDIEVFSKYIRLYRGSSPRPIKEYVTTDKDGVNWIKIGDTKNATSFILDKIEEKITINGSLKSRAVYKGELILANSMSFGKTYMLNIDGCIYDGWFVLREYEDFFHKPFLLQLLNSDYMQNQYRKLSAGGIVQNISSEIVYQTIVPHTDIEEQKKIANCLISIDNLIEAESNQLDQLKAHKNGLMQQLFPNLN